MKMCFKCGDSKSVNYFYKHKGMRDGFLNKCKDCCKLDAKKIESKNRKNKDWCENERKRQRLKYKRLNYKDKQKEWDENKPWKRSSRYKNLRRKYSFVPKEKELHHWNYHDEYIEDFIVLSRVDHRFSHKFLTLDLEKRIFKTDKGFLLNTKEKHISYLMSKGLIIN